MSGTRFALREGAQRRVPNALLSLAAVGLVDGTLRVDLGVSAPTGARWLQLAVGESETVEDVGEIRALDVRPAAPGRRGAALFELVPDGGGTSS